jgi:glutathione S-transferase
MPSWTALVTVVLVAQYYAFTVPIYAARRRSGIRAPAMVGDTGLERAIRVHLNTLEKLAIVFPTLWITAWSVGDAPAAIAGAGWGASRIVYAAGYLRSARWRTPGAILGDVFEIGLLVLATYGLLATWT